MTLLGGNRRLCDVDTATVVQKVPCGGCAHSFPLKSRDLTPDDTWKAERMAR